MIGEEGLKVGADAAVGPAGLSVWHIITPEEGQGLSADAQLKLLWGRVDLMQEQIFDLQARSIRLQAQMDTSIWDRFRHWWRSIWE